LYCPVVEAFGIDERAQEILRQSQTAGLSNHNDNLRHTFLLHFRRGNGRQNTREIYSGIGDRPTHDFS